MRSGILAWSAISGAVVGLVLALLAVGAGTIVTQLLPLPATLARALDRRGLSLALATLALGVLVGGVLGWLEGRLKTS